MIGPALAKACARRISARLRRRALHAPTSDERAAAIRACLFLERRFDVVGSAFAPQRSRVLSWVVERFARRLVEQLEVAADRHAITEPHDDETPRELRGVAEAVRAAMDLEEASTT